MGWMNQIGGILQQYAGACWQCIAAIEKSQQSGDAIGFDSCSVRHRSVSIRSGPGKHRNQGVP